MSSGKRKLSFLGFAPQVGGEDEVRLDEEMERVVWGDAAPRLPAAAEPRRDSAAPPPYLPAPPHQPDGASSLSSSELSPGGGARSDPQMSGAWSGPGAGSPRAAAAAVAAAAAATAAADARHVQFDAERAERAELADALDDADDERRAQRSIVPWSCERG